MYPPFQLVVTGRPATVNRRGAYYNQWIAKIQFLSYLYYYGLPTSNIVSARIIHFHIYGKYPDVDNIIKPILDGMKGIVFIDDKLVGEVRSRRFRLKFHQGISVSLDGLDSIAEALSVALLGEPSVAIWVGPPPSLHSETW